MTSDDTGTGGRDDSSLTGSRYGRASTIVGGAIAIAGATFVVRAINSEWGALRASLGDARPAWLGAGLFCAAAAMLSMALPWRKALSVLGTQLTRRATLKYYFAGEIGKYVPGGVWSVVGRSELARSGGVAPATAYTSVALSLVALYLGAMLLVVVLLPFWLAVSGSLELLWILVLLPIGLAVLHPRPLRRIVSGAERVLRHKVDVDIPAWSTSAWLVVRYLPSWVYVGTSTWCIARAFYDSAGWVEVVLAAVLSWIIGFLLVPIPGGFGVREAAFVALAGGLPVGIAATVAIAARLSFMLVDGTGALLAGVSLRRIHRRGNETGRGCDPTSELCGREPG